jgi:erythronate-4-phosphate dehydrogenase
MRAGARRIINAVKITADRYIPGICAAFAGQAEVELVTPSELTAERVRDCDALLVRSVTRVDASLLEGSRVRLVATATSGVDHVDTDYLAARGIDFAAAPGSNARPVAEYVLGALCAIRARYGGSLRGLRAGIIGCGHVGSWVSDLLSVLGMECVQNDPPLAERTGLPIYRPLAEALDADIVTLHVPLTRSGKHPTALMLDADRIAALRPGVIIINTARGGVLDEDALCRRLAAGGLHAVLDVWRGEPAIDAGLLAQVAIGTPHIAGYSLEAKQRAAQAVCQAVCRRFELVPSRSAAIPPQDPTPPPITLTPGDCEDLLCHAVLDSYDPRADDLALRRVLELPEAERARYFHELRDHYALRREFTARAVRLSRAAGEAAILLRRLGFRVLADA